MTNAATRGSAPPGSRAWLQGTAFIVIGLFALYFYAEYATRYFVWSEESYGAYFWGKRVALAFHLFGGTLALTMGLPQLWMGFRNRYMNVHRWTGRLYVVGVLVGSIGAITACWVFPLLAAEVAMQWREI